MLLDEPVSCLIYGALTFNGYGWRSRNGCISSCERRPRGPTGLPSPDDAHFLVVALVDSGVIGLDRAAGIAGWLGECLSAAADDRVLRPLACQW